MAKTSKPVRPAGPKKAALPPRVMVAAAAAEPTPIEAAIASTEAPIRQTVPVYRAPAIEIEYDEPAAAPPPVRRVTFIVQAFATGKGGQLVPAEVKQRPNEPAARWTAERMLPRFQGVLILRQEIEGDGDDQPEPVILSHYGEVPETLLDTLAMAA